MPKITKIATQANKSDRLNIFVDDKFLTGLDQIYCIQYGLRIGQEITLQFCEEIKKIDAAETVYKRALKFLAIRPQSTFEIKQKLLQRKFPATLVQLAIKRLQKNNLLNDEEFAISWIKYRLNNRPRSMRHIISELSQKGIDGVTIQLTIQQTKLSDQELSIAVKLLETKIRQTKLPVNSPEIRGYLARKGFNYNTILAAEKVLTTNAENVT